MDDRVPPQLLPGPAASVDYRRYTRCAAISIPGLLVVLIGNLQADAIRIPVVIAGLAWVIGWTVASYRARLRSHRIAAHEHAARYTTRLDDPGHHFWHLDARTGEVLRRPGEDDLPRMDQIIRSASGFVTPVTTRDLKTRGVMSQVASDAVVTDFVTGSRHDHARNRGADTRI